jgi:hypothetical protein
MSNLRNACLSVTLILVASMAGCVADGSDQSATNPGDEESVANDEGIEANVGDLKLDPADAGTTDSPAPLRFWYVNRPFHDVSCAVGSRGSTRPNVSYPWPSEVLNFCPTKVILHQNANYSGATRCVSPHTATPVLLQSWRSYTVSNNNSICP